MNNAVSGFSRNSLNSRNVLPSTAAATPDVEPLLPGAVRRSQYHKDLDYERGDLTLPKTVQGLGSGGPLPIRSATDPVRYRSGQNLSRAYREALDQRVST
jgi:hypothetical protein